jgi:hypothetical protein
MWSPKETQPPKPADARIAVAVVLLPPPEIMALAVDANRKLLSPEPQKIQLDLEHTLPHLTLGMASVRESEVSHIGNILFRITQNFAVLDLAIMAQKDRPAADGTRTSRFEITRTPDLSALHEAVMEGLRAHSTYDAEAGQFLAPPPVDRHAPHYLNHYPSAAAYGRFEPHITLGTGYGETPGLPILFKAGRVALCRLGASCTCRKILLEFTLRAR